MAPTIDEGTSAIRVIILTAPNFFDETLRDDSASWHFLFGVFENEIKMVFQ